MLLRTTAQPYFVSVGWWLIHQSPTKDHSKGKILDRLNILRSPWRNIWAQQAHSRTPVKQNRHKKKTLKISSFRCWFGIWMTNVQVMSFTVCDYLNRSCLQIIFLKHWISFNCCFRKNVCRTSEWRHLEGEYYALCPQLDTLIQF